MSSYPRETIEFVPVVVTIDGTPVTEGIQYALTPDRARPTTWIPPFVVGDKTGLMIDGLAVGRWNVWARVTSSPEVPVVHCGSIHIS